MRAEQQGVTLIELVIGIAILAILLGIAIPSFASVIREHRLTVAVNGLHGMLFYARSEAITRGKRVGVCTSIDQQTCASDVGWHSGWIAFEDANGNGVLDAGERLLRVSPPLNGEIIATGNQFVRDGVSYVPSGMTRTVGGALQMGTITLCMDGSGRQIVINATGRPRVVRQHAC